MASRPEPISAISPSHNQALASRWGKPAETLMLCKITIAPGKVQRFVTRANATLINPPVLPRAKAMKLLPVLSFCLAFLLAGCTEPSHFVSTDISTANWGKDFNLTDHNGQARQLADFRGKAVVLFFGYTQCPDVCPTTLATMREVMALLGEDARRVQVLFVTVDPARDSPALLARYVPVFHPSFLGLYADEKGIETVAKEFKVFYAKQPGSAPGTYSMDHSASSYAFDPQGHLRLLLRYGEAPANIAADLRRLLGEK
jgi:protein SCO1/2